MTPDDKQLERLAQWLDGQKVSLSDKELAWGQDFCADEQDLAGRLDVEAPAEAMARIAANLTAAIAKAQAPEPIVLAEPVAQAPEPLVAAGIEPAVVAIPPAALPVRRAIRWSFRRVAMTMSAAAVILLAVAVSWTVLHNHRQGGLEMSANLGNENALDVPLTPYVSQDDKEMDQLARQIEATAKTFAPTIPKAPTADADMPPGPLVWPDDPPKLPRS